MMNVEHGWPEPIRRMAEAWPLPHVTRADLSQFTCNTFCGRSAANADCAGVGIKGRFRIGKIVAYPLEAVCDFLTTKYRDPEAEKTARAKEKASA